MYIYPLIALTPLLGLEQNWIPKPCLVGLGPGTEAGADCTSRKGVKGSTNEMETGHVRIKDSTNKTESGHVRTHTYIHLQGT